MYTRKDVSLGSLKASNIHTGDWCPLNRAFRMYRDIPNIVSFPASFEIVPVLRI
jgi:hypothetical protein